MEYEHSDIWFLLIWLTAMVFLGVMIFMGASIVFGSHDPDTINNYNDCIHSEIPPRICNLIYPPLNIQPVNWTVIPFP